MHADRPLEQLIHPAVPAWQAELARGYSRLTDLLQALDLTPARCGVQAMAASRFPLRVPRGFVARMRPGDPRDPLLLQVLPAQAEDEVVPGYTSDPVGDLASLRAPGLLHKYAGRALLITTGACAIHCRYCFRQAFPYSEHHELDTALATIAADKSLHEVILSGGDPLVLGERRLGDMLSSVAAIPHVERIRLHTRVPVVLPERVDGTLLRQLGSLPKPVVIVIHVNHARELDNGVIAALRSLGGVCAALLNQSVLLRGINASVADLHELSVTLFRAGVLPYYLHQLDAVAGAARFAVPDDQARQLVASLGATLPGYLVPRLVREIEGRSSKTPLAPFGAT